MTKAKLYFTEGEPEDIEILEVTDLIVTGITSIGNVTSNTALVNTLGIGTTNPQYNLDVVGNINLSGSISKNGASFVPQYSVIAGVATYAQSAGIATYSQTAGISTVAQNLTGTPNVTVGIITAGSFVSSGSTAVYVGINTSTIDSNSISVHYMTFDTASSAVNISNFGSGKKTELIIRNSSSAGARSVIIRTSTTASSHQIVPTIVHSGGTITNGTVSISASSGLQINIFNVNGTVVGTY